MQHGKKWAKRNANRALGISDSQAERLAPVPVPVALKSSLTSAFAFARASGNSPVSFRVTFAIDSRVVELSRIEFKLGKL